ncbi:MAG: cation-translocating P-type ATPase, partial [Methanobrevibacter sp.]|nr:cation-translocating P-type ATPase [Methanobrevibacter sp.]
AILIGAGLTLKFIGQDLIAIIIFLIVAIGIGQGIIKHGLKSLLSGEVKIELLVTIATIGAFLLGDGLEGATLMLLFYLAEYIEHYALDRSKKSLSKLVNLNPETAIIKKSLPEGKKFQEKEERKKEERKEEERKEIEEEVNVTDLDIGDIVIVKPGDKIPIDGVIVYGNTSVNQASITGESLAVSKSIGDEVYSSTINEEGYIEIEVTKTSENTIFSRIVDLIKESEEKKAKIDLFIDKFARYYTPLIMIIAILVAIIPPILFKQPLGDWVYRSLVLLVISCPCALAISTPVSMVSAITAGTKNGIIIKGGEYIEELNRIKAILFDKTGTLTEGRLEIANMIINKELNISEKQLIEIACSIEGKSKHPIAKAFNDYQSKNNIAIKEVENFESIAGKGLKGKIDNVIYYVGKKELFNFNKELELQLKSEAEIEKGKVKEIEKVKIKELEKIEKGKTEVIIGTETEILGYINLNDKIREEGKETIENIKSKAIKTIMLTGDNEATAISVGNKLGLDKYYSNLLPEDKLNMVEKLSKEYKDVAMVGDGVNDTPSLARANVGIAMGMGGADVAIETADIVLMQDNLSKVDFLIKIAKKTMNVVKENVGISIAVKSVLAILGVVGYIGLLEAVIIGDMGLTLLVVINALRIGN